MGGGIIAGAIWGGKIQKRWILMAALVGISVFLFVDVKFNTTWQIRTDLDQGLRYYTGDGVPKDYAKAAKFDEKACDGGIAHGCYRLGVAFDGGEGVKQDPARAVALFQQACDGGDAQGCKNLGIVHE
jgi:hypothetical protein